MRRSLRPRLHPELSPGDKPAGDINPGLRAKSYVCLWTFGRLRNHLDERLELVWPCGSSDYLPNRLAYSSSRAGWASLI